jgi:predicted protein tyrosine phosphatase
MQIRYMSQHNAEKIEPDNKMAIISIVSPGGYRNLSENWEHKLHLDFDDIDTQGVDLKGEEYILFNKVMAKKVIDFIKALPEEVDYIVVHCWAGVSRSAAVAKFLAGYYGLQFPEHYQLFNKHIYKVLTNTYNDILGVNYNLIGE